MTSTESKDAGHLKCCLCGQDIVPRNGWSQGNNAEPVASGRCCDECNAGIVIPARLLEITSRSEVPNAKKD